MPNWCYSTLKANGPKARIAEFLAAIQGPAEADGKPGRVLDFNRLIPMPEEVANTTAGSEADDGLGILDPNAKESEYRLAVWRIAHHEPMFGTIDRENGPFPPRDMARAILLASTQDSTMRCVKAAQVTMEVRRKYQCDNWYDWSCKNWGTKWNACESIIEGTQEDGDNTIVQIRFETAWSWPEPVISKITSLFPDLEFSGVSDEEGGFFWFDWSATGGVITIVKEGRGYREDQSLDPGEDDDEPEAVIQPATPESGSSPQLNS